MISQLTISISCVENNGKSPDLWKDLWHCHSVSFSLSTPTPIFSTAPLLATQVSEPWAKFPSESPAPLQTGDGERPFTGRSFVGNRTYGSSGSACSSQRKTGSGSAQGRLSPGASLQLKVIPSHTFYHTSTSWGQVAPKCLMDKWHPSVWSTSEPALA